ncbi:MAG: polysaccharide biosynthesis/export family protein [Terriglobales bacterium]
MRQSETMLGLGFTLVLLACFDFATAPEGWSQSAPSATGVTQPGATSDSAAPSDETTSSPSELTIGGGDLLKVSVLGAAESDQEVRVDQTGSASLNFIGAVHLGGLTPTAAQTLIAKKLEEGGFYNHPQVSVFTKEYATQGISVLGEVQKPGVYPVLGSRRLFDVLAMAGGTSQKAGQIVSVTRRDHPEAPRSLILSNNPTESAKSNIEVFAGDTITVSRAGVVYVVGDVKRPSGVTMDNGTDMTVLQAIAVAEGTNPTAALNNAKLIRKTPHGPQETPLPLKDMLQSKAPDVRLQAEDIIFVPNSAAKTATRRTLEAIIQTATGLAIYGARP